MSELHDPAKPNTDELLTLLLVQTMRMYDVLMHMLDIMSEKDEERAAITQELLELHEKLGHWGPLPFVEVDPEVEQ